MDSLFAQSTCKTVWAQLRGRKIWGGQGGVPVQSEKEKELEVSEIEKQ